MNNHSFPRMINPPTEEAEAKINRGYLDRAVADFQKARTAFHDQVSGFWQRKPRARLAHYEAHQPVFLIEDGPDLEAWLEGEESPTRLVSALMQHYTTIELQLQPPMPPQPISGPTGMPMIDPAAQAAYNRCHGRIQ